MFLVALLLNLCLCFGFTLPLLSCEEFQDLPALYLKGGSIIPVGPSIQLVGEANLSDDLTLLVALDEHGMHPPIVQW